MLFKIRDASGERKYLITASNLTELTLTINKSSKNVLLKYSFNLFYIVLQYCLLRFFPLGWGLFLTLLIDLSFPTLGNLIQKFQNFSNSHPLPALPPSPTHGVYIDRCIISQKNKLHVQHTFSSNKQKNKFARAARFLPFFAVVLHNYNAVLQE